MQRGDKLKNYTIIVINQNLEIATCHIEADSAIAAVKGACITVKEENPDWIVMPPVAIMEGTHQNIVTETMKEAYENLADHLKECPECQKNLSMPHKHNLDVN